MSLTLTVTLVVAFSFLVSRTLQRYAPRHLASGTAYLLLGFVVGPQGTGLIEAKDLVDLEPVVSLTLGVIGFVIGLPLVRQLESVPVLEASILSAVLVIAALTGLSAVGLTLAGREPTFVTLLTLGAGGAATSLQTLRDLGFRLRAAGRTTTLLRSLALVSNVAAVLVSGCALALADADLSGVRLGLDRFQWLLASGGLGVACGLLFAFFVRAEDAEERTFLATVGVIIFASGMASALSFSPLLVNAVAGATVALAAGKSRDLGRDLERLERPTLIVLTIFAGAMLEVDRQSTLLAPLAFYGLRFVVIRLAAGFAVRVVPSVETTRRIGDGLIPIGGVALAIGVSFQQVKVSNGNLVLVMMAGSMVLSELLARPRVERMWIDAGEVPELLPSSGGGR